MRVRQENPYQRVWQRVRAATPEERKNWTDGELFHVINGYGHALNVAEVPEENRGRVLSELLRNTHELTRTRYASAAARQFWHALKRNFRTAISLKDLREGLADSAAMAIDGLKALYKPPSRDGVCIRLPDHNEIMLLRQGEPFDLGANAVHEAIHYLWQDVHLYGHTEFLPYLALYSYVTEHRRLLPLKLDAKTRLELAKGYGEMRRKLVEEKKRDTPERHAEAVEKALVTNFVAGSIRHRAGNEKADEFLTHVHSGSGPVEAWLRTFSKETSDEKFYGIVERLGPITRFRIDKYLERETRRREQQQGEGERAP